MFIHFAKETEFYPVYAEPGDTIIIRCTYDKDQWFQFDGTKGKVELNFITQFEKQFGFTYPDFSGYLFTNRLNFDYYYNLMHEKYVARIEYISQHSSPDVLHTSYTEFSGDNREYLLFFFSPAEEDQSLIKSYLESLAGKPTGIYIDELYRRLDEKEQFFEQEDVLTSTLTDTLFRNTTVASLLENHVGKVLYIDFWLITSRADTIC